MLFAATSIIAAVLTLSPRLFSFSYYPGREQAGGGGGSWEETEPRQLNLTGQKGIPHYGASC